MLAGRFVWSVYLERGEFSLARKYAAVSGNKANVDVVLTAQAQGLLKEGKAPAAAELLALTNAPFEDAALRLLKVPASPAFLPHALRIGGRRPGSPPDLPGEEATVSGAHGDLLLLGLYLIHSSWGCRRRRRRRC